MLWGDLRDIGRYTQKTWGRAQRDSYLKDLDSRFQWLAEHPMRGRHRPDVASGYYSFPHGGHVIFYMVAGGIIDIIGILHQAMDVDRQLEDRKPPE